MGTNLKETILSKINKKDRLKRYTEFILGVLILSISFNLLLLPNNIVYGGVSGISIIVNYFADIDPSIFIMISSIILLIISYIFLGKEKSRASVMGSILFPIFVKLTANIGNYITINTTDQLLLCVFGGVLSGFGTGLIFRAGFTTGGTDILNQMCVKYLDKSMGTAMIIIDGIIVLLGSFVFGWTKFMYAIVVLYIISIMTDKVLLGISDQKAFYIITKKQKEISEFVIKELGHTVTLFDAKGGYTKNNKNVLFTVIPTKEYYKLKAGISEIDPDSFFVATDAYEVSGGE